MPVVPTVRSVPVFAHPLIAALVLLGATDARGADPYQDKVLPFLKTYCVQCHTKQKPSGDLDLTKFTTAAKIVEDFRQWEHVVTFLKKEEMPPAKAKQPAAELRAEMVATLEQLLLAEARKFAGDPGVVPPRRLTNAEYDYTIRDLTGADIRPAKSFPIDPASGEGFNNTGEALTMSPNLFKKYYAAAEQVGDHAAPHHGRAEVRAAPGRHVRGPPEVLRTGHHPLLRRARGRLFPVFHRAVALQAPHRGAEGRDRRSVGRGARPQPEVRAGRVGHARRKDGRYVRDAVAAAEVDRPAPP